MLLLLLACAAGPVDTAPATEDTAPPPVEETEAAFAFAFAVMADPHVSSDDDNAERLRRAIDWINAEAPGRGIELAVVLGDIGWSDGLSLARDLLDTLDVPYAPVIGDNEVHFGDEMNFPEVFDGALTALAADVEGWTLNNGSVWNPDHQRESAFGNFAFDYGGVRFIATDWASRSDDAFEGEMGDLHDFEGGTWGFFESQILGLGEDRLDESVIMLSHNPMAMQPGGFWKDDDAIVAALTSAYGDTIWANFAGHLHLDAEIPLPESGYDVYVTDAVWDDSITLRVVEVWATNLRVSYQLEHVTVP